MLSLALAMSGLSLVCVRLLDLFADAEHRSHRRVELAVRNVISCFGILTGFAWEKCFDEALVSLSSQFENRAGVKLCLGLISLSAIIPAWRHYLVPMLIHEGWRYGFVIKGKDHLDELVKQHTEVEKKKEEKNNSKKRRHDDIRENGDEKQSKKSKTQDTETLRHRGISSTGGVLN